MNWIFGFTLLFAVHQVCYGWPRYRNDSVLKSVVVIFRHGDRNVIHTYPNDPYRDISYWSGGWGQLIDAGKERHFELGKWFRNRYDGFLPENYSYYDIRVQSTDVDRTLMSAAAHLAGLYWPREDRGWNPLLKWQPIPIHTIPREHDALISMHKPCPKYEKLHKEFLKSKEIQEIQDKASGLYTYINKYHGGNVTKISQLSTLYSTLFIEERFNYTLPDWTKKIYPDILAPYAGLDFSLGSHTPELARLRTGPLLNEIITHFTNITQYKDATFQKYKIYSGHDSTIGNVLTSLGVYNFIPPPYSAAIIFELRQNCNGYFLNIFYKNETNSLHELEPKGCQFNCDLNDFKEVLKPVTVSLDQWKKECKIK